MSGQQPKRLRTDLSDFLRGNAHKEGRDSSSSRRTERSNSTTDRQDAPATAPFKPKRSFLGLGRALSLKRKPSSRSIAVAYDSSTDLLDDSGAVLVTAPELDAASSPSPSTSAAPHQSLSSKFAARFAPASPRAFLSRQSGESSDNHSASGHALPPPPLPIASLKVPSRPFDSYGANEDGNVTPTPAKYDQRIKVSLSPPPVNSGELDLFEDLFTKSTSDATRRMSAPAPPKTQTTSGDSSPSSLSVAQVQTTRRPRRRTHHSISSSTNPPSIPLPIIPPAPPSSYAFPTKTTSPAPRSGTPTNASQRSRARSMSAANPSILASDAVSRVGMSTSRDASKDSYLLTASPDELRQVIADHASRFDELSEYLQRITEQHIAEKAVLQKRISHLEKDARKKDKEVKGMRWLVMNSPHGGQSLPASATAGTPQAVEFDGRASTTATRTIKNVRPRPLDSESEFETNASESSVPLKSSLKPTRSSTTKGQTAPSSFSQKLAGSGPYRSSTLDSESEFDTNGSESSVPLKSSLKQSTLTRSSSTTGHGAPSTAPSSFSQKVTAPSGSTQPSSSSSISPSPSSSTSSLLSPPPTTVRSRLNTMPTMMPRESASLSGAPEEDSAIVAALQAMMQNHEQEERAKALDRISTASMASSSSAAGATIAYAVKAKRSRPPSIAQVLEQSPPA